ncbi:MAG: methyltransferase domain-containing protein [Myxococcota bacterium]
MPRRHNRVREHALAMMRCTHCGGGPLTHASGAPALTCTQCRTLFPILDGIPDMTPPSGAHPHDDYRTEAMLNLIAPVYDPFFPVVSTLVWRCSPLRFIDHANLAIGRANRGVLLAAPVDTGALLSRLLTDYHDVHVFAVDRSWRMLRTAQRQLANSPVDITFLRVDFGHLPIADGVVDCVQSTNGLHTFPDRARALAEFRRTLAPSATLSGSALIRGAEPVADAFIEWFERQGFFPLLRTAEFLHLDLREVFPEIRFETHGAVMFYTSELSGDALS